MWLLWAARKDALSLTPESLDELAVERSFCSINASTYVPWLKSLVPTIVTWTRRQAIFTAAWLYQPLFLTGGASARGLGLAAKEY